MNKVYLLIGGNMGDRMANLDLCLNWIEKDAGHIIKISSVFETEAWGYTNQALFLNQAVYIETTLDAKALMENLLFIEKKMGRERNIPMGPRTIDIDIIYFNEDIIQNDLVTIPHPRLSDRRFVLLPLTEIAPEYIHPILNKSNATLLKECGDSLSVYKKTDF